MCCAARFLRDAREENLDRYQLWNTLRVRPAVETEGTLRVEGWTTEARPWGTSGLAHVQEAEEQRSARRAWTAPASPRIQTMSGSFRLESHRRWRSAPLPLILLALPTCGLHCAFPSHSSRTRRAAQAQLRCSRRPGQPERHGHGVSTVSMLAGQGREVRRERKAGASTFGACQRQRVVM